MDKVTKSYKKARQETLDDIAACCKEEAKGMNSIADYLNGAL